MAFVICPRCRGEKVERVPSENGFVEIPCSNCNGEGVVSEGGDDISKVEENDIGI